MLLAIIGTCYAARLDTTYLPPGSAGSAGGAGLIHPPGHGGGKPIKHSGPVGFGGPGVSGSPSGPSRFDSPSGPSSFGGPSGPSGHGGHGGPNGFGPGGGSGAYAGGKFE